ncbi:MAG: putative metal-dependent enzyme (double-stranded beta helix superfamily) [Acidimicrobiales bacterium]|jgi:predicted metal-dependent enzyme (double-stranded beta helix superfamily)
MTTRTEVVSAAMDDIRRIEADLGVTRDGVEAIRDRLIEMSNHRALFSQEDFPPPGDDVEQSSYLYRLAQDADERFALYAQSSRGGVETPVHNHTTWACIVGFHGQEHNRFFERSDDGVTEIHDHVVERGTGVAMLPEDLHSIHIEGEALNFHCYGLALERLTERDYYNPTEGIWKKFRSVSAIQEARTGLQSC